MDKLGAKFVFSLISVLIFLFNAAHSQVESRYQKYIKGRLSAGIEPGYIFSFLKMSHKGNYAAAYSNASFTVDQFAIGFHIEYRFLKHFGIKSLFTGNFDPGPRERYLVNNFKELYPDYILISSTYDAYANEEEFAFNLFYSICLKKLALIPEAGITLKLLDPGFQSYLLKKKGENDYLVFEYSSHNKLTVSPGLGFTFAWQFHRHMSVSARLSGFRYQPRIEYNEHKLHQPFSSSKQTVSYTPVIYYLYTMAGLRFVF